MFDKVSTDEAFNARQTKRVVRTAVAVVSAVVSDASQRADIYAALIKNFDDIGAPIEDACRISPEFKDAVERYLIRREELKIKQAEEACAEAARMAKLRREEGEKTLWYYLEDLQRRRRSTTLDPAREWERLVDFLDAVV